MAGQSLWQAVAFRLIDEEIKPVWELKTHGAHLECGVDMVNGSLEPCGKLLRRLFPRQHRPRLLFLAPQPTYSRLMEQQVAYITRLPTRPFQRVGARPRLELVLAQRHLVIACDGTPPTVEEAWASVYENHARLLC